MKLLLLALAVLTTLSVRAADAVLISTQGPPPQNQFLIGHSSGYVVGHTAGKIECHSCSPTQTPVAVNFNPPSPVSLLDTLTQNSAISAISVTTSDLLAFGGTVSISAQSSPGLTKLSNGATACSVLPCGVSAARNFTTGDVGSPTVTVQAAENNVTASQTLSINITGQSISSFTISCGINCTFIGGSAAAGTQIGTISVSMSPPSPSFSGTVALSTSAPCDANSGLNNSSFQFAGSGNGAILETAVANLAAGSYKVCALASEGNGVTNSPQALALTITGQPPAFFVATDGLDTNNGLQPTNQGGGIGPFLTFGKCQSAMQQSGSIKTCYIRAGLYNVSATSDPCALGQGHTGSHLNLVGADSGETWSNYPPDGYGNAIIDGGVTGPNVQGPNVFSCVQANASPAITFTGLQFQNFFFGAIYAQSAIIMTNNTCHDAWFQNTVNETGVCATLNPQNGGPSAANSVLSHNYAFNTQNEAFAVLTGGAGQWISGLVVSYNAMINTCEFNTDCGAFYIADYGCTIALPCDTAHSVPSTNITVSYNYIRDINVVNGGSSNGFDANGLYFDDGSSNITATGNIITGIHSVCYFFHGGSNNHVFNNICDNSSSSTNAQLGWDQTPPSSNFSSAASTGNTIVNNIFTAKTTGTDNGYQASLAYSLGAITVNDNSYWNFGSGGNLTVTCNAGGGSTFPCTPNSAQDATPTHQNPLIHCWGGLLAATSPTLNAPTSYPAQPSGWDTPGFWGPPGFTIPHTGTAPSWPTTSGDGVTCTATN